MPFIKGGYLHKHVYHGGTKDLNKLEKLVLQLRIQFPYTQNADGTYNLTPVTVNLYNDLEIDSTNSVYAVKWGDNDPATDTVSQADNPVKHVHTYAGGSSQSSNTKTFLVEVYGEYITKYYPISREHGNASTGVGYIISAKEVSLRVRYNKK